MDRLMILGLSLSLIAIGECQPKQAQQPQQNPCKFRDPTTARVYDLTPLISSTEDYVLRNDMTNDTMKFQLCHELHHGCGGAGTYAACLERGNQNIGIGKYPPIIAGEDGRIMLRFIGDECQKDMKYTVSVIMHCDYSETDKEPALFPYEANKCDMHISWKSKLACGLPPKSVDCTVKNKAGDVVDLSSLRSQMNNYVIPSGNKSSIILNVCHSVIPGYGAVCTANSSACYRNESSQIATYSNLGDVQSPQLIDGTVALQYEGGKICSNADATKTTIFFICDFGAHKNRPELVNRTDCSYTFMWKTAAACSDKELEEYSLKTASPCKISDPITNFEYDLGSLKGQDYIIKSTNGSYKMSVCGPLLTNKCGNNTGVCRSENLTTEGLANSKLLWSPEGPYLNYTNGSVCEGTGLHYTIISFICSPKNTTDKPKIVIDEKCYLKIQFPTSLVCETESMPNSTVPAVTPHPMASTTPTVPQSTTNYTGTTDSSPRKQSGDDVHTSHSGLIAFLVIFLALGLICGVYLANPIRRTNLYSSCRDIILRRSPTAMNYSQVNSVEETNLLLDASNTCCQSDSDDDLLRL